MVALRRDLKSIRHNIIKDNFKDAYGQVCSILDTNNDDGVYADIAKVKEKVEMLRSSIEQLQGLLGECLKLQGNTTLPNAKQAALTVNQKALDHISKLRTIVRNM